MPCTTPCGTGHQLHAYVGCAQTNLPDATPPDPTAASLSRPSQAQHPFRTPTMLCCYWLI